MISRSVLWLRHVRLTEAHVTSQVSEATATSATRYGHKRRSTSKFTVSPVDHDLRCARGRLPSAPLLVGLCEGTLRPREVREVSAAARGALARYMRDRRACAAVHHVPEERLWTALGAAIRQAAGAQGAAGTPAHEAAVKASRRELAVAARSLGLAARSLAAGLQSGSSEGCVRSSSAVRCVAPSGWRSPQDVAADGPTKSLLLVLGGLLILRTLTYALPSGDFSADLRTIAAAARDGLLGTNSSGRAPLILSSDHRTHARDLAHAATASDRSATNTSPAETSAASAGALDAWDETFRGVLTVLEGPVDSPSSEALSPLVASELVSVSWQRHYGMYTTTTGSTTAGVADWGPVVQWAVDATVVVCGDRWLTVEGAYRRMTKDAAAEEGTNRRGMRCCVQECQWRGCPVPAPLRRTFRVDASDLELAVTSTGRLHTEALRAALAAGPNGASFVSRFFSIDSSAALPLFASRKDHALTDGSLGSAQGNSAESDQHGAARLARMPRAFRAQWALAEAIQFATGDGRDIGNMDPSMCAGPNAMAHNCGAVYAMEA